MARKSKRDLWTLVTFCLSTAVVTGGLGCRTYPITGPDLRAKPPDQFASTVGLESSPPTKPAASVGKSSGESSLSDSKIVLASAEQTSDHSSDQTSRKDANTGSASEESDQAFPIDLPTALRLAGANNLQIQFAQHRVSESLARLDGAAVLWLPSISAGPLYNKHDGRIQDTRGDVIEASRNSALIGGGPVASFHLGDAIFEPLAARQLVRANEAALARTMNDTLLAVALAYIDLVEAEQLRAVVEQDVHNVKQLVELTDGFAKTGQGLESDAARARSELATRQRELIEAQEAILIRSTRLANLLRLDPAITLHAADQRAVPVVLLPAESALKELITHAITVRPENEEQSALVQATQERLRHERLRPLVPDVVVGFGAGGFGGGEGSHFGNFSDRTDFTASALWELRNLGFGNRALRREREAQLLQADTLAQQIREQISAEVTEAYHQVQQRHRQIEVAQTNVDESLKSLELNMNRIRGVEGLPIEVLQAIQSVAAARRSYLTTVTNYNRAQFLLLRAVGQPLTTK